MQRRPLQLTWSDGGRPTPLCARPSSIRARSRWWKPNSGACCPTMFKESSYRRWHRWGRARQWLLEASIGSSPPHADQETVSDNTNALAVEAAVRRRRQLPTDEVHLAACSPVLRAQPFGGGAAQHFRLFALASSARDTGSRTTQTKLLRRHIRYWQTALGQLAADLEPQVEITVFDDPVLAEQLPDAILTPLANPHVPVVPAPQREHGRRYYTSASLRLALHNGDTEVGDGGITTWTATLTGNAKERCMISVLATQRLAGSLPRNAPV